MRVLLDTCVWGGAQTALTDAGHAVQWIGELPEDPGDKAILAQAWAEKQVLVTLDKDFGELAVVRGMPHTGIIRLVGVSAIRQGPLCVLRLENYGDELASGAIVTADPGRVWIRPAETLGIDADQTRIDEGNL